MGFEVYLTDDAVRDLEELYEYILSSDATVTAEDNADRILNGFERVFSTLAEHPQRGAYPKELLEIGIREYREVFFKPWRVIYRVLDLRVYVMLVADGRRDMQSLLQKRLLQA